MIVPAHIRNFFLAIVFILATVNFTKTTLEVIESSRRLDVLKSDVVQLEAEKESLDKELVYKQSDEFVALEARNKFGFVKPGEEIFVYPQVLSEATHNSDFYENEKNNPQLWFNLFFSPTLQ